MATRKPKTETTDLARWDEELAKFAQQTAAVEEGQALGQFFSLRSGILTFNEAALPGNQMVCIIADHVLENVYYEGDFNPEKIETPGCFAFGRDLREMAPHADATAKQSDKCEDCIQNAWGSSSKGRGKACRNTRRLALLAAATYEPKKDEYEFFKTPEDFAPENNPIAFLKLPVTSVKAFSAYVNQLARVMRRPPFAVYTRISVTPDPKTQFRVNVERVADVPAACLQTLVQRHEEAKQAIIFPYQPQLNADDAPAQKRGSGAKTPKKSTARPNVPNAKGGKF